MNYSGYWQFWALLAAVFAALTAILAKVGVSEINSNFATFLRTIVIIFALALLLLYTGEFQPIDKISGKSLIFLTLSGLATGASWLCYFRALQIGKASQVAPIDKLSVVFVAIIAALFLGENLSGPAWLGVGLVASGAILISVS
ncbi:EamA family transporter [Sneathiella sp. CAU 1612]|uniref:EamA family transporter n=1 Tax=Sneathiella sedimenti TaxID=2816034 RepID=A0ABS3F6V0_9PROT|nr:EamA family transporter [Sneathiella sedimenti]MBO0334235.1 EamA family transporter [Sneathiella sedimenti]